MIGRRSCESSAISAKGVFSSNNRLFQQPLFRLRKQDQVQVRIAGSSEKIHRRYKCEQRSLLVGVNHGYNECLELLHGQITVVCVSVFLQLKTKESGGEEPSP